MHVDPTPMHSGDFSHGGPIAENGFPACINPHSQAKGQSFSSISYCRKLNSSSLPTHWVCGLPCISARH